MKTGRLLVLLVALLALSGVTVGSASATTVEECQAELATLRADTVAARSSFTNQKDFDGLTGKLDAAATKLAEGKNADAVDKLVGFQTTLNALATAAKPKVDPTVGQTLIAEAQGVIDCINAIDTAWPGANDSTPVPSAGGAGVLVSTGDRTGRGYDPYIAAVAAQTLPRNVVASWATLLEDLTGLGGH